MFVKIGYYRNILFYSKLFDSFAFSALTLLVGWQKGIRPVKNRVVGYWSGYLSTTRCRPAYMAQLMPLPPTVSCFSKIQIGFTFLVPAHPGSTGQRAGKTGVVVFDSILKIQLRLCKLSLHN